MSAELEQVTLAVAAINKVEAGLAALRQEYGGVIYEVTTAGGLESAKVARAAIREPRYEVERIRKAAKAPILALGKKLDSEAARITAELEKIENPIHQQIKAEEDRKEAEKQARIDAEIKRVADLQERVAELRGCQTLSPTSGSTLIAEHIADLDKSPVDETFEEFQQQALDAKLAGLKRLGDLHSAALAHEAAQLKLEEERKELARLRAEEAERQRIAAAERAKQEAADKAKRDAESAAQAEENRRQREAIEREAAENRRKAAERQAELDRQAEEQRAIQRAEEQRLADQRAEVAREQEALRLSRLPPAKKPKHNPGSEALIEVIANHYDIDQGIARRWLREIDWETVAA